MVRIWDRLIMIQHFESDISIIINNVIWAIGKSIWGCRKSRNLVRKQNLFKNLVFSCLVIKYFHLQISCISQVSHKDVNTKVTWYKVNIVPFFQSQFLNWAQGTIRKHFLGAFHPTKFIRTIIFSSWYKEGSWPQLSLWHIHGCRNNFDIFND